MQERYELSKQKLRIVLAEVVKQHRKQENKSISKISAEIMMTKSMWTDLERGIKDPQFSTLWRVSEALNCPVDKLVAEVKDRLGNDFTLID